MPRSRGFTLIELVVIIALLGILAFLALPKFTGVLEEARLMTAAREVASELRYAQALAVAGDCVYQVEFIQEEGIYSLSAIRDGRWQLVRRRALPKDIFYEEIKFGKGTTAAYTGYGSPSWGGLVVLANPLGQRVEITVAPATGRVLVQE